jgi:hypothetical protein
MTEKPSTPDTPLFVKTHDFLLWLLRHSQRFPKNLRHSYTLRLETVGFEETNVVSAGSRVDPILARSCQASEHSGHSKGTLATPAVLIQFRSRLWPRGDENRTGSGHSPLKDSGLLWNWATFEEIGWTPILLRLRLRVTRLCF